MSAGPKSPKDTNEVIVSLCFWDLSKEKLQISMLVKLTQGVSFINILQAAFAPNILSPKNYKAKLQLEKICVKHFCTKKGTRKMLMKLTPETNPIKLLFLHFLIFAVKLGHFILN